MDTVTYSHPLVQKELTFWLEREIDVTDWPEVARTFEVTAVPVALMVAADGTHLERVANFVEPEIFSETLRRARIVKD